jgi:Ran GTPase-activating protein 1
MAAAAAWSLEAEQRQDVLRRITASICCLAQARGLEIPDAEAYTTAVGLERKAYTTAEVSSSVTTGSRPIVETTKGYTRKLAELVLEAVNNGGKSAAGGGASSSESVDLVGSRDFMTKESTEEALVSMLAAGSAVTRIRFSTKSFGRDAARVAATPITNCAASLTDADISDVIAGRPEEEALDALRILGEALSKCGLKGLNISDNALGEKGVRACAAAFTNQAALESMAIQNVGCSIHACAAVEELLVNSQDLKQLHLFNNMTDNAGAIHIAKILARAPMMEDFKLASSRVGPEGGNALARALCAGTALTKLDLSDNPMTSDVAAALAACVAYQPNLRHLNLNDTSLTDEGIEVVCRALTGSAPKLEQLELALNEVTPDGAKFLAIAMLNKPVLWRVNIRENELEDRGAVVVAKAVAAMPALRVLDACGNQVKRVGAVSLARAALSRPALEMLALDENFVSEAGLDEVRGLFEAAGKAGALGPLDENMEEDDEELDDDGDDGNGEDELSAALAKATL